MGKIGIFSLLMTAFFIGISMTLENFSFSDEFYSFEILGTYLSEDRIYEYGRLKHSALTPYDGFLLISDQEGETVERLIIFDEGESESFVYLANLGNERMAIVCETYHIDIHNLEPQFRYSSILLYDESGAYLGRKTIHQTFANYYNHGGYLILVDQFNERSYYDHLLDEVDFFDPVSDCFGSFKYQFQGEASVNGDPVESLELSFPGHYEIVIAERDNLYNFSLTIWPGLFGVEAGGEYQNAIVIYSLGILFLNGDELLSGTVIEVPGNYELVIEGEGGFLQELYFTIHPVVENIKDGDVILDPVRIYSNALVMEINGEVYENGLLSRPGRYLLLLFGVNEYVKTLEFQILPRVVGIEAGGVYEDRVDFWINGDANLNGVRVSDFVSVDSPGVYELLLFMDDEEYSFYRFSIVSNEEESNPIDYIKWISYALGVLTLCGLIVILKKK